MSKKFAEGLNSWVVLLTSIVALGTAIFSFYQSNTNSSDLSDITSLPVVAVTIQKDIKITYPKKAENDSVEIQKIYAEHFNVKGTYSGDYEGLENYDFWIVIQSKNGYIRVPGKITFTADRSWYLDDVYLGIYGKFKVLIVISNNRGSDFMQTLIASETYTFSELPSYGFQVIDFVDIERIDKSK